MDFQKFCTFISEIAESLVSRNNNDITLIPELVYYFVKDGCAAQGMKFTMDVEEWLGQIEVTDLETIAAVLVEVMGASSEKKTKLTKVNH